MDPRGIVEWLGSPPQGLRSRVLHSGIWAFSLNFLSRASTLLKTVIAARVLAPDAFGIYGLGLVVMMALQTISDLGFDKALIQHKEEEVDTLLETAWTVRILQGAFVSIALVGGAPFVARLFSEPALVGVLQAFAVVPLLQGISNPSVIYFQKDLTFHKEFMYKYSGNISNAVVAVVLVFWIGNLWALVLGLIAGNAVKFIASYLLTDEVPGVGFSRADASQLFGFGKWLYGSVLLMFLIQSGDDLFVGWLLTATALGFYRLAFQFGNAPATEVSNVIQSVIFPAFSKLQNDEARLRKAFEQLLVVIYVVTVPMTVGIILVAPSFTRVVLGEKWIPMIPILQLMAVGGLLRAVITIGGGLFRGYGTPESEFRMNVVRFAVIVVTIFPLSNRLGVLGVVISVTLGLVVSIPVFVVKTRVITGVRYGYFLRSLAAPALAVSVMAVTVWLVLSPTWKHLAAAVGLGATVYIGVIYVLYRFTEITQLDTVLS